MTNQKPALLPFYVKCAQVVMGLSILFYVIHIGREILAPLLFSILLAILLNPVCNYLQRKGLNRVISIVLAMLAAFIVLAALVFFIGSQIASFKDSLPEIKTKFTQIFEQFVGWISDKFNVDTKQIKGWINDTKEQQMNNGASGIGTAMGSITGFVLGFVIIPVYVFLLLFYKPMLIEFLHRIFPRSQEEKVEDVLGKTKVLIQSYLVGLMIEASIIATLDSIGLLLIGVEHAILFGIIAAFLNLIPYIGGLIATALPAAMSLTSDNPNKVFLVIGLFAFVQLLDNNFLIPKIVASKVKVNALVSIFMVIVGGALWGIPGMFFAIPVTAIVKVIFDSVDQLKPLGYVLGDDMPPVGKSLLRRKNGSRKKSTTDKKQDK